MATEIEQAFARGWARRGFEFAEPSYGSGRASARARDQCGASVNIPPPSASGAAGRAQIVTNPNCSTVALTMALAPLKQFGIRRVIATTMQAVSGAGYPGVPSMDIIGNVVPFIGGEEEKMQQETQKILGEFAGEDLRRWMRRSARTAIACRWSTAIRSRYRSSFDEAQSEEIIAAMNGFRGVPQQKRSAQRAMRSRFSIWRSRIVRNRARRGT